MRTAPLPPELLALVIAQVTDPAVLATLMRANSTTYALAAPHLYADVTLTDTNLHSVFLGLFEHAHHKPTCTCLPELKAAAYPNAASDARKRALLAYTATLSVQSVPGVVDGVCPVNLAAFPALQNVLVKARVQYHDVPRCRPTVAACGISR